MLGTLAEALARIADLEQRVVRVEARLDDAQGVDPAVRAAGSAYTSARSFVYAQLATDGPLEWTELVRRGAEFGHSEATLERARREVAVWYLDEKRRYMWRLRGGEQRG